MVHVQAGRSTRTHVVCKIATWCSAHYEAEVLMGSAPTPHSLQSKLVPRLVADTPQLCAQLPRGTKTVAMTARHFNGTLEYDARWRQAALDADIANAANRQAFGRPIKEFQAVSHQLAEMATRLEAARALVYAAAEAHDRADQRVARRSAMAKLFATETAQQVIDVAIQVHGAVALERGHLLEHLYREVRAPRIYEGTSEIQRAIIARDLFRGGGVR